MNSVRKEYERFQEILKDDIEEYEKKGNVLRKDNAYTVISLEEPATDIYEGEHHELCHIRGGDREVLDILMEIMVSGLVDYEWNNSEYPLVLKK